VTAFKFWGTEMQDVAEQVEDAPVDEGEYTVEIPVLALAGFGGCFRFVQEALGAAFSGHHLSREQLIGMAVGCGR